MATKRAVVTDSRNGYLTIIAEDKDHWHVSKYRKTTVRRVIVRCDCGVYKRINLSSFSETKSCGCKAAQLCQETRARGKAAKPRIINPEVEKFVPLPKIDTTEYDIINRQEKILIVGEFTPHEWEVQLTKLFTLTNQYLNK